MILNDDFWFKIEFPNCPLLSHSHSHYSLKDWREKEKIEERKRKRKIREKNVLFSIALYQKTEESGYL